MFRRTSAELLSVAILPLGFGLAVYGGQADALPGTDATVPVVVGPVSYSGQVAPMFAEYCADCHGTDTKEAGLDLTTYEAVMKGSDYGPVLEAGDGAGSLLVEMIAAGEMPQEADPMSEEEVALITAWIDAGAENN